MWAVLRPSEGNGPSSPGTSSSTQHSSDTPTPLRQNKITSTDNFHTGGDLQYHLRSPSLWHLVFLLGAPVLCFLNGCAYYLFWRSRYLEASAIPHLATEDSLPVSSAVILVSDTPSVAPYAFYGVTAGFAFAFILTQWTVQECARAFIRVEGDGARATSFLRCGLLFEVAFLPLTVSQMVLMGQDFHLHRDAVRWLGLARVMSEGEAPAAAAAVENASASQRYVALWIVSFMLTTTAMVVVASAMWTNAVVTWLQRRVFAAYREQKTE